MRHLALIVLFATTATVARSQAVCSAVGKDRWTVKTSPPVGTHAQVISFADFTKLPVPAPIASAEKGAKLSEERYADGAKGGPREGDLVSVTGWVRFIKTSTDDCDYHIQMESSKSDSGAMIIVEIPKPDADHISDAALRAELAKTRAALLKDLHLAGEPHASGNVIGSAYMTVEGALFFDAPHYPNCGKRGVHAAASTCWEIHPITSVRFAPKPTQ